MTPDPFLPRSSAPEPTTSAWRGSGRPLVCLIILTLGMLSPVPARGEDARLLHAGPMLAYAELRSSAIWLQTERAAEVQLRVYPDGLPELARLTPVLRTTKDESFAATFRLHRLEPGVTYHYEVYVDGARVVRPYPLTFRTQPLWQWRTDAPDFTALIGSCAYMNEPAYDRPGRPYGSHHEIFTAMAEEDAELMIWMGDNVYTREVDFFSPSGLAARYWHDRALPELQPLLAAMNHYATWDDHDYGPDNSDWTYPLKGHSFELFEQYWPAITYGLPETPGTFQMFQWSDVAFILLDDRMYRSPNAWPESPERTMLGAAQLEWLKGVLVASRATFKVVVCGNQVLNPNTRFEAMIHYPNDRQAILDWIVKNRIEGVVFLSGDRHKSELIRIQPEGGYPLYDFTSSPLTAGARDPKPGDEEYENPDRVPGTLLGGHSFGRLRVEGPRGDRVMVLQAAAVDGSTKWEHRIPRTELSFQ